MFPLFSALKESPFKAPKVNLVLLHLKRKYLMEWVRAVMAVALGVEPGGSVPPIWMQDEVAQSSHGYLTAPLEGVPADEWVGPTTLQRPTSPQTHCKPFVVAGEPSLLWSHAVCDYTGGVQLLSSHSFHDVLALSDVLRAALHLHTADVDIP
jgi:hypothetical protein